MVPFLYTVKGLEATGPADGFAGNFTVASYRGATFMDPQASGAAAGRGTAGNPRHRTAVTPWPPLPHCHMPSLRLAFHPRICVQGRGAASGWDYTKGLQAAGNQGERCL